jgi:hypothetical protein
MYWSYGGKGLAWEREGLCDSITNWNSQQTTKQQYKDMGFFLLFFFSFFFYYSYVHTRLGSFLPPAPTPSLTTHSAPSLRPPPIPSRNYFALLSNFVVERV